MAVVDLEHGAGDCLRPMRFLGNAKVKSPMRDTIPSIISEANAPGAMAFTLIRYFDHSTASVSVMRTMAALVIEYSAAAPPGE